MQTIIEVLPEVDFEFIDVSVLCCHCREPMVVKDWTYDGIESNQLSTIKLICEDCCTIKLLHIRVVP